MIRKTKDENKEVLTAEQESNLIDKDALIIDTVRTLYKYIDEKDKKVYFYLSSNYQDLYVLIEGDNILLRLPKKVDINTKMNILDKKRPYLIRKFIISIEIGSKTGNTDIKFAERWFDDLHKSYIVLMEDCGHDYATKETNNFCFELDSEGDVNRKIKPLPLHIFLCFKPETFMNEWNRVELRNLDEKADLKKFKYEFQNWHYHFPVINVFKSNYVSPLLKVHFNETPESLEPLMDISENDNTGKYETSYVNINKKYDYDYDEIRPQKIYPPVPSMLRDLDKEIEFERGSAEVAKRPRPSVEARPFGPEALCAEHSAKIESTTTMKPDVETLPSSIFSNVADTSTSNTWNKPQSFVQQNPNNFSPMNYFQPTTFNMPTGTNFNFNAEPKKSSLTNEPNHTTNGNLPKINESKSENKPKTHISTFRLPKK